MEKSDFDKALTLAYFYLKFRPRTRREVELYLEKRALKYRFSPDVIPSVLEELENQKYVDDKKFVEMYVKDRLTLKPRSMFLIKQELQKLGIPKELVENYFEANPAEDVSHAVTLLQKKAFSLLRLPEKERFTKAIAFLRRKGFSYADSVSAYKTVVGKEENSFED